MRDKLMKKIKCEMVDLSFRKNIQIIEITSEEELMIEKDFEERRKLIEKKYRKNIKVFDDLLADSVAHIIASNERPKTFKSNSVLIEEYSYLLDNGESQENYQCDTQKYDFLMKKINRRLLDLEQNG
ncbi:hypothetical protein HMPREF0490_00669 [Lachnospiraceae bacterium 6_1_37FAA]|nr:hypothetical protein HMPREF0490_00669 [Lachnospiraceae bacterium 6_1_37FAA]